MVDYLEADWRIKKFEAMFNRGLVEKDVQAARVRPISGFVTRPR